MDGGMDKMNGLVLMRSDSGNQILDLDFGDGNLMQSGPHRQGSGHVMQHHGSLGHYVGNGQCSGGYAQMPGANVMNMFSGNVGMPQQLVPQVAMPTPGMSLPLRKLKIVEHHVHRIDTHTKDNGEAEEELVVSNLRHFTLKVAVVDVNDVPILDSELPLQAMLLYENGLPVKQLSNSEPLLVGEPEVVALQGSAVFKLRITSLSSHRDKQRFRIQIAPQSLATRQHEPALTIVSDPMKSVTKLAHRSNKELGMAGSAAGGAGGGGGGGGMGGGPMGQSHGGDHSNQKGGEGAFDGGAYELMANTLKHHGEQIGQLQEMHSLILKQLQDLNSLVRGLVSGTDGLGRSGGVGSGALGANNSNATLVRAQREDEEEEEEEDEEERH